MAKTILPPPSPRRIQAIEKPVDAAHPFRHPFVFFMEPAANRARLNNSWRGAERGKGISS